MYVLVILRTCNYVLHDTFPGLHALPKGYDFGTLYQPEFLSLAL